MIERVRGDDPETAMPPKGDRLTAREVETLRLWIDQGAKWPEGVDQVAATQSSHWAFQTPARPRVPAVNDREWIRNPIDAFILERLERENVRPSAEAERPTLIRRLSLDLLGLPPTPSEVTAFVNDGSADAYERLVDRLLASAHFGERWGRHWLDLARYADSDGYEKDTGRPHAWRYRDWVIGALNRDLTFDQFTIEQLAGDLLPGATIDQKIATGFHRNTLTNKEGGADQEEFRVAAVVDRANTTGTVWMGLTVGCAQCHTHKYDPILQKEYYGLFAFFNSEREVDLPAPLPGEQEKYDTAKAAFDREHEPFALALSTEGLRRSNGQAGKPSGNRLRRRLRRANGRHSNRSPSARPRARRSPGNPTTLFWPRAAIPIPTYTPSRPGRRSARSPLFAWKLSIMRLWVRKGPWRTGHGNFVVSSFEVSSSPMDDEEEAGDIFFQTATADYAQDQFPASAAIDKNPKTGWAVDPAFGKRHVAIFETIQNVSNGLGTQFTIKIDQQHGLQHTLGRFRLSVTSAKRPVQADAIPDDVAAHSGQRPRSAERARTGPRHCVHHRSIDPEYLRLSAAAAAEHRKKAPAPPASRAQTLVEEPTPRKTHVLIRGDFLRPGEEARPDTPAFLPALKGAGTSPTRLELAKWLVDPANPLTARVNVNRIWRNLFGRPLVTSVDDFGTRGERPSHPELLDWLALELPRRGWSQKSLIRLIVTSSTYRQASHARPELVDRDPNNIWLARQNRFRPEAEVIRDLALSVSGLLAPRVGGPSVRPPQPPGISELTYANSAKWVESEGADRYRRGFYTWFQRTSPYPMLMTFDAPDSNVCVAKRERSNTPLQALTLLNDGTFVECAQALGRRIVSENQYGSVECRIDGAIFRACLARDPTPDESRVVATLFENLRQEFQRDPKAAASMAGPRPVATVDQPTLAAWTAVARTILNADEFVTRE